MKLHTTTLRVALLVGVFAAPLTAQQPSQSGAAQRDTMPGPKVGDTAPDFTVSGATRYGLLKNPVKLSDFRGSTVVLAFIVRARTKG